MACACASCPSSKQHIKVKISLMAAVLFAIVASPQLFSIMQSLLGGLVRVATTGGSPTFFGLVLHAAVYGGLTYALMHVDNGRGGRGGGRGSARIGGNASYPMGSY